MGHLYLQVCDRSEALRKIDTEVPDVSRNSVYCTKYTVLTLRVLPRTSVINITNQVAALVAP